MDRYDYEPEYEYEPEEDPENEEFDAPSEYLSRLYQKGEIQEATRDDIIEIVRNSGLTEEEAEKYADYYEQGMNTLESIEINDVTALLLTLDEEVIEPINDLIKFYVACHGIDTGQLFRRLANVEFFGKDESPEEIIARELTRYSALKFYFATSQQRTQSVIAAAFYMGFMASQDLNKLNESANVFADYINGIEDEKDNE